MVVVFDPGLAGGVGRGAGGRGVRGGDPFPTGRFQGGHAGDGRAARQGRAGGGGKLQAAGGQEVLQRNHGAPGHSRHAGADGRSVEPQERPQHDGHGRPGLHPPRRDPPQARARRGGDGRFAAAVEPLAGVERQPVLRGVAPDAGVGQGLHGVWAGDGRAGISRFDQPAGARHERLPVGESDDPHDRVAGLSVKVA